VAVEGRLDTSENVAGNRYHVDGTIYLLGTLLLTVRLSDPCGQAIDEDLVREARLETTIHSRVKDWISLKVFTLNTHNTEDNDMLQPLMWVSTKFDLDHWFLVFLGA